MGSVPILPPGKWRDPEAAAVWRTILEWNEQVGELYRQQSCLHLSNSRFAERMKSHAYKARLEREHKERCNQVEAAIRSHLKESDILDAGEWDFELDLEWVHSSDV